MYIYIFIYKYIYIYTHTHIHTQTHTHTHTHTVLYPLWYLKKFFCFCLLGGEVEQMRINRNAQKRLKV